MTKVLSKVNIMKKLNSSLVLGAALTALSGQAAAELRVVVTPTKTEKPISEVIANTAVITSEQIERLQPQDIQQLLNTVSGLDFRDSGGRGSASGVFIRGTTPNQQIVLLDGVRISSATTGAADLSLIPVELIDRIEVVKGPVSGLYGADAVGGVIQIFTKKDVKLGQNGITRVSIGSNDTQEISQTLMHKADKFQVLANVTREKKDGIDRTTITTGGNNDTDGFEETAGNVSLGIDLNEATKIQAGVVWGKNKVEFDNTFGADANNETTNRTRIASWKLTHDVDERLTVSADLGYFKNESSTLSNNPFSFFETQRGDAELKADWSLNENVKLLFGTDYRKSEIESTTDFPETERDNNGVFASVLTEKGKLGFNANIRYDDNEAYGEETTGSVLFSVAVTDSIDYTISYGTAFVAPSFNQLFFPFFGNENLNPEESETIEVGLRGTHENVVWNIAAYSTNIENLIAFDNSTFLAGNIDEADITGLELGANVNLGDYFVSAQLDYSEARDAQTDEFLTDRALVNANIETGYRFEKGVVSVDVDAEHGRRDSSLVLPGFAVVGLSGVYNVTDNLKLSARIDNLLDKDYSVNVANSFSGDFFRNDGRAYKASAAYSF